MADTLNLPKSRHTAGDFERWAEVYTVHEVAHIVREALAADRRASPPAAVKVAGLGRITNEDNGYLTLQFKDEDAACQFARDHTPSVEVDEMPPLTAAAVPEGALPPKMSWLDAPHDIPSDQASTWSKGWNACRAAVEEDRAQRPENANQPLCDSALRAEPAGTGFLTIGWREALEKLRPDTTTHTHDTEIADAVLDEVIDALDDLEESQRCAAPHEQGNLGEMFIVAGGKWDGVRWVVENSDLATFMRSVLAAGAARQGGDGAPEAVSADRAQQGEPVGELAEWDRILRASVPERWKGCTSPVGAVQSYIAELEELATKAAAPADAPDDMLEELMHKHALIGVAGDNPNWEAKLIAYANDVRRLPADASTDDLAHKLWCAEVNLDGAKEHIDELLGAAKQVTAWLRRNASAERDAAKRAAFIEAHNAALSIFEHRAAPVPDTGIPTAGEVEKAAWISVDDARKPEERKPVLLFVRTLTRGEDDGGRPYEVEGEQVEMGEYRFNNGSPYFQCFVSPMSDNDWITHWMPLPVGPSEAKAGKDA